jgi:uncharacterized protein YfbU (UPF0304 family)
MYDETWTGFQKLNPEDQTEIGVSNIRFEGFHGNSESDLLCYAEFRMRSSTTSIASSGQTTQISPS